MSTSAWAKGDVPGPEYNKWAGFAKYWTWRAVTSAIDLFRPAIERDTRGRFSVVAHGDMGGGMEGRVVAGRHPHLGEVVLKVGDPWRSWYVAEESDYAIATQLVGEDMPGIAKVFGVWRHEASALHAILRERVSTNWSDFIDAAGVSAYAWDLAAQQLETLGPAMWTACLRGRSVLAVVSRRPRQVARIHAGGMEGALAGLLALYGRDVCAGGDLGRRNLGWRLDAAGRPEAVIIDLGPSRSLRGGRWEHGPRASNGAGRGQEGI